MQPGVAETHTPETGHTQTHADRLRPHTSTLVCHSESITQGCNRIGHTLSITERTQSSPTHSPTVSLDSSCLQRDRRLDCIGDQSSQDFLCARLPAYRSPALRVVPTCLCLRGRVVPSAPRARRRPPLHARTSGEALRRRCSWSAGDALRDPAASLSTPRSGTP